MKNKIGTPVPSRELRTYTASQPMTIRTTSDGTKQIAGYAIVWNSPSCDLGGFTELCDERMLDRTLKQNKSIIALRDHKTELLLGNTAAGTLELTTDTKGLAFVISLPQTTIGADTAENVRLGNLTGVSFGFTVVKDDWSVDGDGNVVRTLLDIDLHEISPTSFPAYAATSVSTRSCPAVLRKHIKADPSLTTRMTRTLMTKTKSVATVNVHSVQTEIVKTALTKIAMTMTAKPAQIRTTNATTFYVQGSCFNAG